jgi:hypothetical protein
MASLSKEFGDVFPDKLPYGVPPTRRVIPRIKLKDGARPRHHASNATRILRTSQCSRSILARWWSLVSYDQARRRVRMVLWR